MTACGNLSVVYSPCHDEYINLKVGVQHVKLSNLTPCQIFRAYSTCDASLEVKSLYYV